jgi:glycosyltransferase involved in cell wall biosynthesis
MGRPSGPPRLAVVTATGITADSRAHRAALAAARDGWDVTVVGGGSTPAREESTVGPIRVVRVPVCDSYRRRAERRTGRNVLTLIAQTGLPDRPALDGFQAAHRSWLLRQEARLVAGRTAAPVRRWVIAGGRVAHRLRTGLWHWGQRRQPGIGMGAGDWRRDRPAQVDLDLALVPALLRLAPDVIHASAVATLGAAAQATARLRLRGARVSLLYDAQGELPRAEALDPAQARALRAIEREFIGLADAVIVGSPELGALLRDGHGLREMPHVVRDAPVREAIGAHPEPPSVRVAAGVPAGVPLLIGSFHGPAPSGPHTLLSAMAGLPEVHLAVIADPDDAETAPLLSAASGAGVSGRVHVVPRVTSHLIADYLSSADLGVVLTDDSLDAQVAGLADVLHCLFGRVPVVTSDQPVLREFAESRRVGRLVPDGNAERLADAVRTALDERAPMATEIHDALLAEFCWERQSSELTRLYREIAPRVPPAPPAQAAWSADDTQTPEARMSAARAGRSWRALGDTKVRLSIGPANYAGQAGSFARAVCEAFPDVSAEVSMYEKEKRFAFPADVYLDPADLSLPEVQVAQVRRILQRYSHLIAEAFLPVFGYLNGVHISDDLPMLRSTGIQVALLAHGTEVRHPRRHMERHRFSHFHQAPPVRVKSLTAVTERNLRFAAESGLPTFVTTPDLLEDLPWATWIPLVVDVGAWRSDRPVMARKRPVVLHAPSARWTKGTDMIMPALEDLERRGAIALRLAERLSRAAMRAAVQEADVVIDQVTTGAYGTLSCEAMAAGRPVIAHISDGVRAVVGPDLPIVDATPDTLAGVMEQLLDDRDGTAGIGAASARFAAEWHGGPRTARALSGFLGFGSPAGQ